MPKVKKSAPSTPPADPKASAVATPPAPAKEEAKTKPVRQKAGKAPGKQVERTVVHPKPHTHLAVGDSALTLEKAQELIGWEEVEGPDGTTPELYTLIKKHIRLTKNPSNRWLTPGWLEELKQEVLNLQWRWNGESIVIGEYGNILSGQHRLLAYILACLETQGIGTKAKTPEAKEERVRHWAELHKEPLRLETVLVYGVKETDDVFRTLNCGKKSSLAEVLYRSTYFQNKGTNERKELARMCDWAIKLVWSRTGLDNDPYAPRRTHGEAMDFLAHHPHIIEAVETIKAEYGDDQDIRKDILSAGNAAGVMYLMAASASEGEPYWNSDPRQEADGEKELVSFSRMDDAREFWVALHISAGPNAEIMDPIRTAMDRIKNVNPDTGDKSGGTLAEKLYILAGAWHYFLSGESFDADDLRPKWTPEDPTGKKRQELKDVPLFGGIDRGPAKEEEIPESETVTPAEASSEERQTKAEKAAAEAEERARSREAIMAKRRARLKAERGELPNGEPAPEGYDPEDEEEGSEEEEGAGVQG